MSDIDNSLPPSGQALKQALRTLVDTLDACSVRFRFGDVQVDLMRPVLPVYSHVLDRAIPTEILGQMVRISAVEGLIVMKLIAFRPRDEADIKELLAAYDTDLDLDYVRSEFASVSDANDLRWGKFEAWIKEQRDE